MLPISLRRWLYELLDLEVYRLEDQGSLDAAVQGEPRMTRDILPWKNKIWESKVSNAGDLAIIQNTILKVQRAVPEAPLHLLSDDPDHVSKQYGVVAHPIGLLRSPTALLSLLERMDLVILGGGTVLQDDYFAGTLADLCRIACAFSRERTRRRRCWRSSRAARR